MASSPTKTWGEIDQAAIDDIKNPKETAFSNEVSNQADTFVDETITNPHVKPYGGDADDPLKGVKKAEAAAEKAAAWAKKQAEKAAEWLKKGGTGDPEVGGGIDKIGPIGRGPGGGVGTGIAPTLQTPGNMKDFQAAQDFRNGQMTLAQQLATQAAGGGVSVAGEQLKQAQTANQAATFAQLASQRGGANPGMARQAMQTSAMIQGQTAKDAAVARMQEQMNAQNQLAGVLGAGRQGDITESGQKIDLANMNAQQAQQYNELVAKYAGLNLSAEQSNQMAAIKMAQLAQGIAEPMTNMEKMISMGGNFVEKYIGS